jgi:hypothetical protein
MKKVISLFFLFISLLYVMSCKPAGGGMQGKTSYFLDGIKGNDSNPGTADKPLKSIQALNLMLKKMPGDIYLAGGQVFEGTLTVRNIKGQDDENSNDRSHDRDADITEPHQQ